MGKNATHRLIAKSNQGGGGGTVLGNGTLNYVAKWTPDDTTIGDSQLFDNGTNVGLNTATPQGKFHIQAGIAGAIMPDTGADNLVLENSGDGGLSIFTPAANNGNIVFGNENEDVAFQMFYDATNQVFQAYRPSSGWGAFYMDANGVMIGAAPLDRLFQVVANTGAGVPTFGASTTSIFLDTSNTTSDHNVAIVSGNAGAASLSLGDNNAERVGVLEYDNATNEMGFYTNAAVTPAVRIGSAGNVAINAAVNTNYQLYVDGSTTKYGINVLNNNASLSTIRGQNNNTGTSAKVFESFGSVIGYFAGASSKVGFSISMGTSTATNRYGVYAAGVEDATAVQGALIGGTYNSATTYALRARVASNGSGDCADANVAYFDFLDTNLSRDHSVDMVTIRKDITNLAGFDHTGTLLRIESNSAATGNMLHIIGAASADLMVVTSTGQVGIGTATPNASAVLQVTSTTQGVVITPMTAAQAAAIPVSEGLIVNVSNTDATFTSIGLWGYQNGAWAKL